MADIYILGHLDCCFNVTKASHKTMIMHLLRQHKKVPYTTRFNIPFSMFILLTLLVAGRIYNIGLK